MITEIEGKCSNCGAPFSSVSMNGRFFSNCVSCDRPPVSIRPFAGLVYVVKNANQVGVKIGMTEKPIDQRIKALSSTGVPGRFDIVALFPSDRPKSDEKRIHDALSKKRLAKEHFELEPMDAVLKCYNVLNKRRPIFSDASLEREFYLRLELRRTEMQLRLMGSKAS